MGVLKISVKDHVVLGKNGKGFTFSCDCGWTYDTRVVMSPKPLHDIIRGEQRDLEKSDIVEKADIIEKADIVENEPIAKEFSKNIKFTSDPPPITNREFQKYRKNLATRYQNLVQKVPWKPSHSEYSSGHEEVTETQIKNFQLSNLSQKNVSVPVSIQDSSVAHVKSLTVLNPLTRPDFPVLKKLTLKKSLKCIDCNTYLLLQSTAPGQLPTVNKFLVKFNAIDYMPSIKVSAVNAKLPDSTGTFKIGGQYNYLINIMNPLPFEIKVHLSTVPVIPAQFITNSETIHTPKLKISLTLPESRFQIKPTPSKAPVKSIPTSFLTKKTLISRSELTMRLDRSLFTDQDTENLSSLVDRGNNWLQAPINLFVEHDLGEINYPEDPKEKVSSPEDPKEVSSPEDPKEVSSPEKGSVLRIPNYTDQNIHGIDGVYNIRIPIYITVNSQLPDSIRKLNFTKKELSYGYWNVIDLGQYRFEKQATERSEVACG